MAQLRARSAGQYSGHQFAVTIEIAASDRVDAAVNLVQTTGRPTVADRRRAQTELQKLRASHYTVLMANQSPGPPSP